MHDGRILPFDSVMPSSKIQFLHTKNDNEKWIGFFVPMLQWMSHSETNGIRSSAIWHLTLILPCFFVRQKQFGTFGKKNIGLKNTKVAWGSRPWRAERRKCSSQIMFGSLNSISTLGKMLLTMMSVIIFGTKTNNNTSHWMIYDSVTPLSFLEKLTTSNQVINCNEDNNLRVRERHRTVFALLLLIIMKERNHFYIYTFDLRIHWRVESWEYSNICKCSPFYFLVIQTCSYPACVTLWASIQNWKVQHFFSCWRHKILCQRHNNTSLLLVFDIFELKAFISSWQRLAAVDGSARSLVLEIHLSM